MNRKRYFVMKRHDTYLVAKYPDEKFWDDWGIIAGPIRRKKAYSRMYTEREKVRTLSV